MNNLKVTDLMKNILDERFEDVEEMQRLCEQLLHLSESKNDLYGIAFANLYIMDSRYALGDYKACPFYLQKTQGICEENGYDDLLQTMHNVAGLFYQALFDERSAMEHYLKGLAIAKKQNNKLLESKILNNMGLCFKRRKDNYTAKKYFELAYETLGFDEKSPNIQEVKAAISFLCNIADSSYSLGEKVEAEEYLKKATALDIDEKYYRYRLAYGWCGYYAICGDKEKSIMMAQQLLDDGLATFDNVHFKTGAFTELCEHMLTVGCKALALKYLQLLETCCSDCNIGDYYNYQTLKIRYYEGFGTQEEREKAYIEFYEIGMKINKADDIIHVENALSKIELTKALSDRRDILRENEELEDASHIDELTQLYNRRYISKLISKVTIGKDNIKTGFIMVDVDYFKEYNDNYGHFKGDNALKAVADILKNHVEVGAYPSRYGGDEFLILCVNWSNDQIEEYIQNILNDLQNQQIEHQQSKCSDFLTISIGYTNGKIYDVTSQERILKLADDALYLAKHNGRNCFAKVE